MSIQKFFNADDGFDPVTVTIDGDTYKVDVTPEKTAKIAAMEGDPTDDGGELLARQFAIFTGNDPKVFKATDIRKLQAAVRFIMDTYFGDDIPSNPQQP